MPTSITCNCGLPEIFPFTGSVFNLILVICLMCNKIVVVVIVVV